MIITNSFVWVNYPKTGSTFVREVLREIYSKIESESNPNNKKTLFNFKYLIKKLERKFNNYSLRGLVELHLGNKKQWMLEILYPELRSSAGGRYGRPTPHGTISQIPKKFVDLPIVSAIRNPVSRYISTYNYSDWKKCDQLPDSRQAILSKFPDFPNLDFQTFLIYFDYYYKIGKCFIGSKAYDVGPLSYDFLNFFAGNALNDNKNFYFKEWSEINNIANKIKFLKFSSLNIDIYNFLIEKGFNKNDVSFVLNKNPVNESSKKCAINNSTENYIKQNEWLLYRIFDEF
jgi:hypothetical protein